MGRKANHHKHKPPSRIRYEKSHPIASFRLRLEDYEQLKTMLETWGGSKSDFLRHALAAFKARTKGTFEQGHAYGYARGYSSGYESGWGKAFLYAMGVFKVEYTCSICGGPSAAIEAAEKKVAAESLERAGFGHSKCLQTRAQQRFKRNTNP